MGHTKDIVADIYTRKRFTNKNICVKKEFRFLIQIN